MHADYPGPKKSETSAQLHWVMSQVFPTLIPNVVFEGSLLRAFQSNVSLFRDCLNARDVQQASRPRTNIARNLT